MPGSRGDMLLLIEGGLHFTSDCLCRDRSDFDPESPRGYIGLPHLALTASDDLKTKWTLRLHCLVQTWAQVLGAVCPKGFRMAIVRGLHHGLGCRDTCRRLQTSQSCLSSEN